MIVIYTDGSAKKNGVAGSAGGFGVVVCEAHGDEDPENYVITDLHQEFSHGTTNNREEMKAIIWALRNYGDEAHRGNGFLIPSVYSDSMYCVNSFTNWIHGWKANGWTKAGGGQLENLDLIKEYDSLVSAGYKINLKKIRGHSGEVWNELADKLATGKVSAYRMLTPMSEYEQVMIKGWN